MDPDDAALRLSELLDLAGVSDLASLGQAIGELDRGEVDALLSMALRQIVALESAESLDVAALGEADVGEHDVLGPRHAAQLGADDDELPVENPWADPERPYSAALDRARQLRIALSHQPDLASLRRALGALTADERAAIVYELTLDAWFTRTMGTDASAEDRPDGG